MADRHGEETPTPYVRAAHFFLDDDAGLFGALNAVGRAVELVIVEDPDNPLLRRHAEIAAEEIAGTAQEASLRFPKSKFAKTVLELFGSDADKDRLIENELANLRAIMEQPEMGVFAIIGTEEDVLGFIRAYSFQPNPRS